MRYKILALDHDDTVVKSTAEVHYPAFLKTLNVVRPELKMSLQEFNEYCFDPGFYPLCYDILHFSAEDMAVQDVIWRYQARHNIPACYNGWRELLFNFRRQGGIVCVVSHSDREFILRDYELHFGFAPEQIFDWSLGEKKCKPYPYPLEEMMRLYQAQPEDILVVDDLTPGLEMARTVGAHFAYAAWSNRLMQKTSMMSERSDYTLLLPSDLNDILFA